METLTSLDGRACLVTAPPKGPGRDTVDVGIVRFLASEGSSDVGRVLDANGGMEW